MKLWMLALSIMVAALTLNECTRQHYEPETQPQPAFQAMPPAPADPICDESGKPLLVDHGEGWQ